MKTIVWIVIVLGAGYLAGANLSRYRTNGKMTVMLGIVMALLCISAVIRVGNAIGWWSLSYKA